MTPTGATSLNWIDRKQSCLSLFNPISKSYSPAALFIASLYNRTKDIITPASQDKANDFIKDGL